MNYYLADGRNNNKIIGPLDDIAEVNEYLNALEMTENWEEDFETFQEYKEQFSVISSEEMEQAVSKFGARKRKYWS